jgi:hypothetical protein
VHRQEEQPHQHHATAGLATAVLNRFASAVVFGMLWESRSEPKQIGKLRTTKVEGVGKRLTTALTALLLSLGETKRLNNNQKPVLIESHREARLFRVTVPNLEYR